jgi:hypothetical protein
VVLQLDTGDDTESNVQIIDLEHIAKLHAPS